MHANPLLLFTLFGVAYGIVLQRSGFCFSQAAFELFYLRSRDAVNGVMAGLLLATLGFGAVTLVRQQAGLPTTPHLLLLPAGVSAIFGGALFGLGMTLAGMCAVGTLQRLGEGYGLAWVVFAGVLAGAATYPFAQFLSRPDAPALSLADAVGPRVGYALTLLALAIAWLILLRPRRAPRTPPSPLPARLRALVTPALLGGVALGLLNTAQMAVASPWTAGYPLALIPSLLSSTPDVSLNSVAPPLALNAGLVFGAAASSLVRKQFRFTYPRRGRDILVGLLGGMLMGWGIRAAHACNIGGVFSALPSLALSGWLYLAGLLPGAWLGTKAIQRLR